MRYGVSGKQAIAVSIHAANESGQADDAFPQDMPKKPEDAKKAHWNHGSRLQRSPFPGWRKI
jgi:hypothetical protein